MLLFWRGKGFKKIFDKFYLKMNSKNNSLGDYSPYPSLPDTPLRTYSYLPIYSAL